MAVCNKGITQFYLPPTHKPYLPLLPSRKASPPFGRYQLVLLATEAHRCEKHAQRFYAACPAETRTHDLLIASPILYRQRHDATSTYDRTSRIRNCGYGYFIILHVIKHKVVTTL